MERHRPGISRDVGDAVDPTSERLKRISLVTWAPGTHPRSIHIQPDKVTGRRINVFPPNCKRPTVAAPPTALRMAGNVSLRRAQHQRGACRGAQQGSLLTASGRGVVVTCYSRTDADCPHAFWEMDQFPQRGSAATGEFLEPAGAETAGVEMTQSWPTPSRLRLSPRYPSMREEPHEPRGRLADMVAAYRSVSGHGSTLRQGRWIPGQPGPGGGPSSEPRSGRTSPLGAAHTHVTFLSPTAYLLVVASPPTLPPTRPSRRDVPHRQPPSSVNLNRGLLQRLLPRRS